MSRAPFQRYRLEVIPMSPVHVGSGEAIEPYEYVLRRQGLDGFLLAINMPKLLADLSPEDRKGLDALLDRAQLSPLRAWLRERADHRRHMRFAVQVQPGAFAELERNQDNPDRLGRVELMTRHGATGRPFIPGSSIKGAIRTALVDRAAAAGNEQRLAAVARDRTSQRSSAVFEAHALGHLRSGGGGRDQADLYRDPLRQMAIADCMLPDDATYIDRVRIIRRLNDRGRPPPSDAEGIQMHRDVTWSLLDGDEINGVGECRVYDRLHAQRVSGGPAVTLPLGLRDFVDACNEYYLPEVEAQLDDFTPRDAEHDGEIRGPVLAAVGGLNENECVVRLGRHSHFECTVLSRPFFKPPPRGFGKTRTYVDGRLPLGWAKLRFLAWDSEEGERPSSSPLPA